LDGQLYAIGGRSVGDFSLDTAERFDPEANGWEELPPLPQGSGGLTATAVNGDIYAVGGGDDNDGWVTPASWAFDPEDGQWRRLPDLGVPRHGHAAAAANGRIYIFGGAPCEGYGKTNSVESLPTS
jgi:N-acetylneuraminic acid mutarotase